MYARVYECMFLLDGTFDDAGDSQIWRCVYMYVCICTYKCMHVCMNVSICVYECMCVCVCVPMYVCMYLLSMAQLMTQQTFRCGGVYVYV